MQNQPSPMVNIQKHFAESSHEIWRAWTDAEIIRLWFGSDPNGTVLDVSLDVRPGGSFEITFANADGTMYTCFGIYTDVLLYQKLIFSWTWKNNPDVVEWVSILFREEHDGTLMDFEIANIDASTTHQYEVGWKTTFEKLARAMKSIRDEG